MNDQDKRLPLSESNRACEMLRQAIQVLCSNAVSYNSSLSIDAIIGITIDNAEIVFVNIHEIVEKDNQENSGLSKVTKPVASIESTVDYRVRDTRRENDEDNFEKNHNSQNKSKLRQPTLHGRLSGHLLYESNAETGSDLDHQFKIKDENDIIEIEDDEDNCLTVSMNDKLASGVDNNCSDVVPSGFTEVKSEIVFSEQNDQFMCNDEYLLNDGMSYNDEKWSTEMTNNDSYVADEQRDVSKMSGIRAPGLMYRCRPCQRSFVYHGAYIRHKRMHQTRSQSQMFTATSKRDAYHRENSFPASEKSNRSLYSSDQVTATKSGVADGEVGTIYTCSICGQKIRHQSTFIRHKKQHEGISFRCDICNFETSRRDSLLVHRRRCLMKCQQFLGVQ